MPLPEGESASQPPPRLLPRALALLALLALGDLWANRHFDVGLDHPGALAPLGAALTAAVGLMDKLGAGDDAKAWLRRFWIRLGAVLSPTVLAVLWVIAIITGGTVSSVVVSQDAPAGAVRLTPAGTGLVLSRVGERGTSERYVVTTTPFSKRYTVKVDGFLPATFDVPPLVGHTVAVARDLRPEPSILFRPSLPALASLQGGRFTLYVKRGKTLERIGAVEKTPAAFLLGRPRPIPADWNLLWRFELEAGGAQHEQIASALLSWSRRAPVASSVPISPGMTLVAEVRSRADKVVACREWVVGTEDVADVPLHDVREESQDGECHQG